MLGLADDGDSPERGQQMPQYVLEEVLREVAAELPTVDLRLGWRLQSLDAPGPGDAGGPGDGDGPVHATLLDPAGVAVPVTAEYVVGADGARSVVREQIGARYVGATALRPNTGLVFRSRELVSAVPHPPAVQTWLLNRQTPGMMGPIDRDGLWWLIAFGVDGRSADFDPARLISGALGRELPVEVVSTDPWTARMELVDRCRRGRVFLVGDAAHLNPPFGGHGLNTGIGDAVDLGWKLAAALAGWGGPALLDSYEAERRPLHRRVIDEATSNMATLAPELLDDDLDRPGPDGDRARSAAASRIEQTKRAEYFSTDLVLGHRYQDSPVLQAAPPATAGRADGAVPGGRLPHHWVTPELSTLDLVTGAHAILTADGELGARAGRAAAAAGLPVTVTTLERPLMRRLGAELIVVRPDQVVAAVWPLPGPDRAAADGQPAETDRAGTTELIDTTFLDTTMAMLGGRQGADTTWTRSR